MLATLVIGLREGLEAALIVGIIAAFLRKNGKSLLAMWLGVALAVVLSLAVGVGLDLVERALPQARQEGMESVIGAIAIVFVTGMILWMSAHARGMKKALEAEAADALSQGGAYALAAMAFLAVLKEGFETSVFLLATFSAAQSALLAATGAVIGLLMAVGIGWGIYVGGVRINLSRFFRYTGVFLVLVAAGLVITSLRTAHEAGWLNAGQQPTANLSWLVAPGTVRSALITGVLGIPADPRRIEVMGWFAYLIPVALVVLWPPARRPGPVAAARLRLAIAAALAAVALGLAALYPPSRPQLPVQATLLGGTDGSGQPVGTARLSATVGGAPAVVKLALDGTDEAILSLPEQASRREEHDGVEASVWTLSRTGELRGAPTTLTLDQVIALSGGRIPVGLSPTRYPGPYTADWSVARATDVWIAEGVLLDAAERSTTVLTLSGGGLRTPRTLTVDGSGSHGSTGAWRLSATYRDQAVAGLQAVAAARSERQFWAVQLPAALASVALLLAAFAAGSLIRLRRAPAGALATSTGLAAALLALSTSPSSGAVAPGNLSAPLRDGASQVMITLTGDNGGTCVLDHAMAKAGPITFAVTNRTATAISEIELQSNNRILGEKENLAPGLPTARFTVTLGSGTYQIYCPGARQEMQNFTVTGKAAAAPTSSTADILADGTRGYAHYVNGVVDGMVTAVSRLKADIDAGELARARAEYPLSRVFYERIESDVDGFVLPGFKATDNAGNLDYLIDMRASNLDPRVGWHGFHAIERDLFRNGSITGQTKQLAAELQSNVVHLDKLVKALDYRPEDLANGAADLLEEVQSTKITGEEEAFSHFDLVDFAGNIEGAQQAFAFLEPGLQKIDPDLTARVNAQFARVNGLLDSYRDRSVPGGYRLYTAGLRASDAARLSRSIQALQEPLSQIAEKVATAGAVGN